jgi:hypothetical protein
MNSRRIYHNGEQPSELFSQQYGTNKFHRYFYTKIGKILDIDYERYKIKVEWQDGSGSPDWFPISFSYVGPASQCGAMPEIGALVLCSFIREGQSGKGTPLAAGAYLPVALQAALEHNALKRLPDSLPTEEDNLFFLKFRKLQKGDMIMSSLFGGELFINRDVELRDGLNDSILMRSSDQSIIMTSLNNFMFVNGVMVSAGPIIRNKAQGIFDAEGNRVQNQLLRELSLSGGKDNIYVVPKGQSIEENSLFYSEYRVDVDEITDGSLDVNEINSHAVTTSRDPIVSMIMGNYAGHQELGNDLGKMLRPSIFSSSKPTIGEFELIECAQNKGVDEVSKLGVAFAVHLLKTNGFFGFDKEGHLYINLNSSSSANPLGAGKSMSLLGSGSLKEMWGKNADTANSWDLVTKGGIKWVIGNHNARGSTRSIDISTSKGIKIEALDNDVLPQPELMYPNSSTTVNGYAYRSDVYGNQKVVVGGNETLQVSGESSLIVDGLRHEEIRGAVSSHVIGNKSTNVTEIYTQVVLKEMQGRYGKRKETVNYGQELTVLTGDIVESIKTLGNKKTTLTAGNIEETIIKGDRKVTIIAGNYKVKVGVGGVDISAVGNAKLTGLKGVTIQGLKTDINSATVNLGVMPIKGGVVTGLPGVPSTLCYVTGLPPKGSTTVKASI